MEDFSFWWYIVAAVIYFLTRGRKKQPQKKSRPGEETPTPQNRPKSFEELLREITDGRAPEGEPVQEPVEVKPKEEEPEHEKSIRLEGERRAFADDESKKVYEDSIKMAEGANIAFERDEHFKEPRLFKKDADNKQEKSYADELMDGFDTDEAKKAIIYSEILNRKY